MRVFCFHEIDPGRVDAFDRQLAMIRTRWGGFCKPSQALSSPDSPGAVISFDDGDWTVAELAQPLLDARGVKALLYVVTGYVVDGHYCNGRERRRALDWDQLGRWLEAGHEIGSHSHTHANFRLCTAQQIIDELEHSRELLRKHLGVRAQHFAYPWGQCDARVLSVLEAFGGFATAATIDRGDNGPDSHRLALRRDLADPAMGSFGLRCRALFGSWDSAYRLLRQARGRPMIRLPGESSRWQPGSVPQPQVTRPF